MQAIDTIERASLDRYADDWQASQSGHHTWQMGRSSRSGNDDSDSPFRGVFSVFDHPIRRPMRRDDRKLVRDRKEGQGEDGTRCAHDGQVGGRAHDDAH